MSTVVQPFFFFFNVLVYVTFFTLAFYFNDDLIFIDVRVTRAFCGIYAITYLILAVIYINYGSKLAILLS